MKFIKKKNQYMFTLILMLGLAILTGMLFVESVLAAESVSVTVLRRTGVDWGFKINGDLTVKGSGSEGIVRMELYFNETLVANSSSNYIVYYFNTEEFPDGSYIIQLRGWDSSGNTVTDEVNKTFFTMSDTEEIGFLVGVIVFILGAVGVSYFMKKKNSTDKSNQIKKDNIQIDDI